MFSVGLALTLDDFKRVFVQPKAFFIGAFGQMVMPLIVAFILIAVWPMDPALKVGVIILAACPTGVTSNLMTHLGRGDTALAVSLTAITSIVGVFTMPITVGFAITHFMAVETAPQISVARTIMGVFLIVTVPIALGMLVRAFATNFALRFEKTARTIASVLFVLIVFWAIYSERANIVDYFIQAGPAMLVLNVVCMGLAYILANVTGLGSRQRTAIVIECGLHNGTLAIFVAATLLGNTTMMIPGGIYSLLMFATGAAFMIAAARREALPA
jgi:BASS family bile acid:Na+ symporter